MPDFFDPNASKLPASLCINGELLRAAKERRINLSQTLESYLAELLLEEKQPVPQEQSLEVEEYGRGKGVSCLFTGGWRQF
jgi:antitoxin CcdA